MILATLAVLCGLVMLVWSADRFVDGAARTASYFKVPPMLIGMLVVGFGTSAPELMVSALSAIQNNPGIALGNAYGSNITNIALILGITALISPITVLQQVLRKELLVLTLVTGLAVWQLWDGQLTRIDAIVLLVLLAALVGWTVRAEQKNLAFGLDVDAGLPHLVMVDGQRLRQVLLNLLANAVKFSRDSRPARIEVQGEQVQGRAADGASGGELLAGPPAARGARCAGHARDCTDPARPPYFRRDRSFSAPRSVHSCAALGVRARGARRSS